MNPVDLMAFLVLSPSESVSGRGGGLGGRGRGLDETNSTSGLPLPRSLGNLAGSSSSSPRSTTVRPNRPAGMIRDRLVGP